MGPIQGKRILPLDKSEAVSCNQCCGSMTFWCGSGSVDPCLWLMYPDPDSNPEPDPAIFNIDLQGTNKKLIKKRFSAYYFLKVHLHKFSKISQKEVKKQ
jgi:hypothetical protein